MHQIPLYYHLAYLKGLIVNPYYISVTEVTFGENFTLIKELGKGNAKIKFSPDTSLWFNEFPYTYNPSQGVLNALINSGSLIKYPIIIYTTNAQNGMTY